MNADWDALASAAGVVLWTFFLVLKRLKKKNQGTSPKAPKRDGRPTRQGERVEFKRDYEPIEPK